MERFPFVDDEGRQQDQAGPEKGAVVLKGRQAVQGAEDAADR